MDFSTYNFVLITVGLWAVFQFGIVPTLRRRLLVDDRATAIGKAAIYSGAEAIRAALLILAISSLIVLAIIGFIQMQGGNNVDEIFSALATVRSLRETFADFSWLLGAGIILLLILALFILSYRSGKAKYEEALKKVVDRKRDRLLVDLEAYKAAEEQELAALKKDLGAGRLEALPPTEAMEEIDQLKANLNQGTEEHAAELSAEGDEDGLKQLWEQLDEAIAELNRHREQLDLARRVEERLANREEPLAWEILPPTETMEAIQAQIDSQDLEVQEVLLDPELDLTKYEKDRLTRDWTEQKVATEQVVVELDLQRRMDVKLDDADAKLPTPKGLFGKLQNFFVSVGLMKCLSGASRVTVVVSLLLLVPSLLVAGSASIENAAATKARSLDALRVNLSTQRAIQGWSKKQNEFEANANTEEPTDADKKVLDTVARAFEISAATYFARTAGATTSSGAAHLIRRYATRAGILRISSTRAVPKNAAKFKVAGAEALTGKNGRLARTAIKLRTLEQVGGGPITPYGKAMRRDLERAVKSRPALMKRWRTAAKRGFGSFQQAATRTQLQGMLLSRLMGAGLAGTGAPAGEAAATLKELSRTPASSSKAYQRMSNKFMADLTSSGDLGTAMKSVEVPEPRHNPIMFDDRHRMKQTTQNHLRFSNPDGVAGDLRKAPPSAIRTVEPHVRSAQASRIATNMYRSGVAGLPGSTTALRRFNGYFPSHSGSVSRSNYHRTLKRIAAGPNGRPALRALAEANRAKSFRRSRSFVRLRGYRRIGGVLIGRSYEKPKSTKNMPDIRDLSWRADNGGILLKLSRANGKILELGPYHPEVVHLALAYAADGRPITVTMTTASPLRELRIQLHPVLVDTRTGCRAIEIDRLVSTYGLRESVPTHAQFLKAREYARATWVLYWFAWAVFVKSRLEVSLSQRHHDLDEMVGRGFSASWIRRAKAYEAQLQKNQLVLKLLNSPKMLGDTGASPLLAKPEFFHPILAKLAVQCANQSRGLVGKFALCVAAHERKDANSGAGLEKLAVPLAMPPRFEMWSGVRERKYQLNKSAMFVRRSTAENSIPLRFMLQAAFATPPRFVSGPFTKWWEDQEIEKSVKYFDKKPWEIDKISFALQQSILRGVAANSNHRDYLKYTVDFTRLQRLFRAAIAGDVGKYFPIKKLQQLAKDTLASVKYSRTDRWNARPGVLEGELYRKLGGALSLHRANTRTATLLPNVATLANQCFDYLGQIIRQHATDRGKIPYALAKISKRSWAKSCNFVAFLALNPQLKEREQTLKIRASARLVQLGARIQYSRDMRQALGVWREDQARQARQKSGAPACKPM